MSVSYDKSTGTWKVFYSYYDPIDNKKKRTCKRGFALKRDAQKFEATLDDKPRHKAITFSELVKLYIESRIPYTTAETRFKKEQTIRKYGTDFLEMSVSDLNPSVMSCWLNDLSQKDVSLRQKNKVIEYIRSVSMFGYEFYSLPHFAKMLKQIPKTSNDVHLMQVINVEQFQKLMSNVPHPVFKAYFTFLFTTGVRRSEGVAVLKSDIKDNSVSITKSMKAYQTGFKTLKNASSKRIIPLDNYTMSVIAPLMDIEGDFLFGGLEPISCSAIQRHFKKALDKTQKDDPSFPTITIHSLRHSHASLLISSNQIPITAISHRLGHSSTAITQEVYLHWFDKDSKKAVEVIDNLFNL